MLVEVMILCSDEFDRIGESVAISIDRKRAFDGFFERICGPFVIMMQKKMLVL